MTEETIKPITRDKIFKMIFGNEEYPNITAYLVSILLNIPYQLVKGKIVFKNTKNNLKRVDEKSSDKDVVFIVDLEEPYDKLKVNLEMNNTKYISSITISRNVYYLSNFHSLGLKENENYNKLLQTIQYNFNRGYVDKTNRSLIDEYYLRNKYGNILTEDIKIVHINVYELSKLWYSENKNKYSKNYQILCGISALMMCTRKKKLEEEIRKGIERIVEEMNYDDAIPERIYDPVEEERRIKEGELDRAKNLARKEGWSKGKIEGIAQGSLDKSIEIAKSMLEKNMNIELIKALLLIAVSSSIISASFVQKIKTVSLIKSSECLIYISFLISMSFGILFTLSFTDYKLIDSIWVGLFSFIGADSLYKAFEDKLFKSFNKINEVKEIERKDL